MIKFHHTAKAPGYVSKKLKDGIKEPYSGRFGTGYTIRRNNSKSSRYCFIDYYIDDGEPEENVSHRDATQSRETLEYIQNDIQITEEAIKSFTK